MSLIGALNVGKSALATHQAAIQVTGNNISNVGNADYTRQSARLTPNKDQQIRPGVFIGTGVNLDAVRRQIDEALQGRIRGSVSDSESADTTQQWLGRVEAVFNELSDDDLSTQLSAFFNSWSNLANKPQDVGLRQIVLQNGESLAKHFQNVRGDLASLQTDVNDRIAALATNADQLAQQVADLNQQIVLAEGGSPGQANGLRDQRDAVLKQLSELIDVTTQPNGSVVDVYVGSIPLVAGVQNRGVGVRQEATGDGSVILKVIIKADNSDMRLSSGQLGALVKVRTEQIDGAINQIDDLAGNLIFELNKIHAAGQGLEGFGSLIGSNGVDDSTVALNDPDAGLDFVPSNGSFVVHVRQKDTGLVTSTLIQVDLDGLNADDMSLNDLATALDGVTDLSAVVTGGKLKIDADSTNVEISFSQDSSGVLAALGVNSFFTGSNARDIALNAVVKGQPRLLAAAKNGENADNGTALEIAKLESQALTSLNGVTLKDKYQATVNGVAVAAATARTNAQASRVVKETLLAQREALSGVSLDEEAVNLMRQQRAFQGAARLVAAVDELMQTVLSLV